MASKNSLKLRCLIEREGSIYVAHCIDLSLGVQGDSVEEVKDLMHEAIGSYLKRIIEIYQEGDHKNAHKLLNRKAPLSIRLKYFLAWCKAKHSNGAGPKRDNKVWAEDRQMPAAFT